MNIQENKLSVFLNKLDIKSNELIKNSFCFLLFTKLRDWTQSFGLSKLTSSVLNLGFVCILVLFASLSLPQFTNDRFGIGLIVLFLSLAIILFSFFSKDIKISFNSIDLLIILFLLVATVSTFNSYFFKESVIGLLKYFVFVLGFMAFRIIFSNSSSKIFYFSWLFVCFCCLITSLIGVYQYFIGVEPLATWEDPNLENPHTRVYSTLGNPNLLAGYILAILPVMAILPYQMTLNKISRFCFFIASVLVLICLIFTGSRGAYIALIAVFLFSMLVVIVTLSKNLITKRINKLIYVIVPLIALALLVFVFPVIGERISTLFAFREHSSNSYRLNVWTSCFKMFQDNWIIGIGPGNKTFRLAYGLYMISGFDALGAYNILLEFALEMGFLGCFVFLLIIFFAFAKLHFLFWHKKSIMAIGICLSLLALMVHGLVDTVFFRPQIFIPFWFLLASVDKIECINPER